MANTVTKSVSQSPHRCPWRLEIKGRCFDVDCLKRTPYLNLPRRARIDATGALHHIVIRGIERKAIFKDDTDREDFFERLSSLLQAKSECSCPQVVSQGALSRVDRRRINLLSRRVARSQRGLSCWDSACK